MIFQSTGLTVSGSSATILRANASANSQTYALGGFTFGTLTYTVAGSTGALVISGSNTFGTINFSDATNARTLTFTAGTTTTITSAFNVNGTAGKLMTVNSSTAGTAWNLVFSGVGIINCDYLSLQDSAASPARTWFAGNNSTNVSGNSGWQFATGVISTDSATATDVFTSVQAALAGTDSAAAMDVFTTVSAALSSADAAAAVDTHSLSAAVAASDSASAVEASPTVKASLSGADTASGVDVWLSLLASITNPDAAIATETGVSPRPVGATASVLQAEAAGSVVPA